MPEQAIGMVKLSGDLRATVGPNCRSFNPTFADSQKTARNSQEVGPLSQKIRQTRGRSRGVSDVNIYCISSMFGLRYGVGNRIASHWMSLAVCVQAVKRTDLHAGTNMEVITSISIR